MRLPPTEREFHPLYPFQDILMAFVYEFPPNMTKWFQNPARHGSPYLAVLLKSYCSVDRKRLYHKMYLSRLRCLPSGMISFRQHCTALDNWLYCIIGYDNRTAIRSQTSQRFATITWRQRNQMNVNVSSAPTRLLLIWLQSCYDIAPQASWSTSDGVTFVLFGVQLGLCSRWVSVRLLI